MKKFSVKSIVAIGIGAALFFVLGRFVAIPSPVPNVNICVQSGLLAFMAAVYGPVAGALIGFIGHALIDFSYGWGIWWSWVIASGVFGLLVGFAAKALKMDEADMGKNVSTNRLVAIDNLNLVAICPFPKGDMCAFSRTTTSQKRIRLSVRLNNSAMH
ncbi:MAG: ECF-type riboflavin transporter substrate-binding protein [Clostridia bacterium]|nr:ECF-type riboflavin transporter substrate-binding protein [Clostridia bacterium]